MLLTIQTLLKSGDTREEVVAFRVIVSAMDVAAGADGDIVGAALGELMGDELGSPAADDLAPTRGSVIDALAAVPVE